MKYTLLTLITALAVWLTVAGPAAAAPPDGEGYRLSSGQTLYVPVYSNIFTGPKGLPFNLAAMLSIRNTDLQHPFKVTSIDYYDTAGKLVRSYSTKPTTVAPLAATYIYLEERDTKGGFGANFIVRWQADRVINAPIIECIMIGATSGQGISFVSPGQVIREQTR